MNDPKNWLDFEASRETTVRITETHLVVMGMRFEPREYELPKIRRVTVGSLIGGTPVVIFYDGTTSPGVTFESRKTAEAFVDALADRITEWRSCSWCKVDLPETHICDGSMGLKCPNFEEERRSLN